MEKPDANGFINVTWPSKSIPHGGIFHTRIAETSAKQQEFLKVLLDESKLSIVQRQKNIYNLRQEESNTEVKNRQLPLVRPRTSRRRSLSAIRESGALEIEDYRPIKKGEDREKLKDILASRMAYGDEEKQHTVPSPQSGEQKIKLPTKKEQWHDLHSGHSISQGKKKLPRPKRPTKQEENVLAYEQLSAMQYSPRRRV